MDDDFLACYSSPAIEDVVKLILLIVLSRFRPLGHCVLIGQTCSNSAVLATVKRM